MKNNQMSLADKFEWGESYLAWLSDAHPDMSNQIAYVDILDDGSINFVTVDADE